jgi:phage head maturation protease
MAVRTLTSVDLMDVSIVTTPAYPATSVAARQMAVEIVSGANKGDVERAKRRRERVLQLLELR